MKLRGKFKVLAIKKKSSAVFFKELKVGDEFELVYTLNGGYKSAPEIDIYVDGKYVHCNNGTQLKGNLGRFELEQVREIENAIV
ncbi:hypothetical protein [Viridibacillus arvi]|uniref:hypothetical protein n=1 Tax=Viridibacillus arvi TaxID=263475 RepID=UPI0034CE2EB3